MRLGRVFLVIAALAVIGACQQLDSILFQTSRATSLTFRVGCVETVTCTGIANDAYWAISLSRIQNSSDLIISPRRDYNFIGGPAYSADMTFNPVNKAHAKIYSCVVPAPSLDFLSHPFTISVNPEPLEILSVTSSQDISSRKIGDNFTIECNVGTCYNNLAVSFFKGGDVLKTIRTAKNIGLYQHTFALDENSAGTYGCKVDTPQMSLFPVMFTLTGTPT